MLWNSGLVSASGYGADAQRIYLAAIRQIVRFLRAEGAPTMPGVPAARTAEGLVQAYIFTILASVFIGAAVDRVEQG
jgi:hypothetical protein